MPQFKMIYFSLDNAHLLALTHGAKFIDDIFMECTNKCSIANQDERHNCPLPVELRR